jgi:hypothetical protein
MTACPKRWKRSIARYGHRWFKLKVGGNADADVERLAAIASVLDSHRGAVSRLARRQRAVRDMEGVAELWRGMKDGSAALRGFVASIAFIEQPVKRYGGARAPGRGNRETGDHRRVRRFARCVPARESARLQGRVVEDLQGDLQVAHQPGPLRAWGGEYFMTGEDLTIQPGLALQQDLALVSVLGLTHLERNGHHYVNGMADLPRAEQQAFLTAHPDLYEQSHGAVRVRIDWRACDRLARLPGLCEPGDARLALDEGDAT